MNYVFWLFELLGTISFALSGALIAIRREMDIFGACVLGMTTAIGGGVIRDLLIGINLPTSLINPTNAIIAIVVSMITYIPPIQKRVVGQHRIYEIALFFTDSVGLGIFTLVGINTAYENIESPNLFTVIFLGLLTGVGGGVLRDVFSMRIPKIFVKNFYACASIIGGFVYVFLRTHLLPILAFTIGVTVVLTLRILAARYRWELPKPKYHDNN